MAINTAGIDPVTALNAVTINPMRMLGINDRGLIKENYKADMLNFYNRHIHILHNDSIKLQVNHLYQRNQKQEENGNQ